jgi:pyridinium-3,5-biscarboxylic acid mononucleotide synthase
LHPPRLRKLLDSVAAGRVSIDAAMAALRELPFENIGFARVDHHRALRVGFPEVIFGQGKTPQQVAGIFARLAKTGSGVLATRVGPDAARLVRRTFRKSEHNELARTLWLAPRELPPRPPTDVFVAVVSAGTSDLAVAEEASVTLEALGQNVVRITDVGVAGLHRLLAVSDQLTRATVIVAVAGMEGALPSVIGGLVKAPVIAVPTSIGYGASFGGLAALLAMLNSCAAGVCVANIDNGFGAAVHAARIARLAAGEAR